jgi:hypothetical protein
MVVIPAAFHKIKLGEIVRLPDVKRHPATTPIDEHSAWHPRALFPGLVSAIGNSIGEIAELPGSAMKLNSGVYRIGHRESLRQLTAELSRRLQP